MNDIFLISIGGSGTRVVESLVHMLAIGGNDQAWPGRVHILIMEMDAGNGNLERLSALVNHYNHLHRLYKSFSPDPHFFSPEIILYPWLPLNNNLTQDSIMRNLVDENEDAEILSKLLYTRGEMEMKIDVGFKGRPSVGVAYFRQLSGNNMVKSNGNDSNPIDELSRFLVAAKDCDRILVVSSCHGGTGATGIPVMEKVLHEWYPKKDLGLLLMLPSFSLPKDPDKKETSIDSDRFNDKVKTVMTYYASRHLLCEQNNAGYKWTYLLGYPNPVQFDNYSEGKQTQLNPVTFFDWFACAAIKQFFTGENSSQPSNPSAMRPGVYICYIENEPWDFSRFIYSFPNLSKDVTIMLQSAIIYQEQILPALKALCNADESKPQKLRTNIRCQAYLQEFMPTQDADINQSDIQWIYKLFNDYTSKYIIWLYEIMSHIPVDYPINQKEAVNLAFHGLENKKFRKIDFKNVKPEIALSLVSQTFINARSLYHVQQEVENGKKIERESGSDSLLITFLNALESLGKEYHVTHKLDTITHERGTPSISTRDVLGHLWETYRLSELSLDSSEESPINGSEIAKHMSTSGQSTALLILCLLETVERFYRQVD